MAQYILTYIGGNRPATAEEGATHMAKYRTWLGGLGESVVSPANPFGHTHTVAPDGSVSKGSTTTMSGYSIIEASSIEEAIAVAQGCPFLEMGGSMEVAELMQMPG
jgi:hypothetical protein